MASNINQVWNPSTCKFLNFLIWKIKVIHFLNIHLSIFHQHLLHIIKFPFNILIFF